VGKQPARSNRQAFFSWRELVFKGTTSMNTDYRALAEERFKWAREAADDTVHEAYVKMGQLWLELAARTEIRSGGAATPPPLKIADE
jgi:hypothetical protein